MRRHICFAACVLALLIGAVVPGCSSSQDLERNLEGARQALAGQRWQLAAEYCDEALAIDPAASLAYELRAEAHLGRRNYAAAAEDFQAAERLAPKTFRQHDRWVDALLALGDAGQAEQVCDAALRRDPERAELYVLRGRARLARQQAVQAELDLSQATRLDPKLAAARTYHALALLELAETEPALDQASAAIELAPQDAFAYWVRAKVRERIEDLAGAAADRAQAIYLDPSLDVANSALGSNLLQEFSGDQSLASGTN